MRSAFFSLFLIVLVPFGALGTPALVLLIRGLIGRQLFTEPRCMRCGYDVRTAWADGGKGRTCPECGADLTQLRAVRFGRRQRRPMMALWGAGLLLFAIAVAVMMPLMPTMK